MQTEQPDKKKLRCFREAKRKSKRLDRKNLHPYRRQSLSPKKNNGHSPEKAPVRKHAGEWPGKRLPYVNWRGEA